MKFSQRIICRLLYLSILVCFGWTLPASAQSACDTTDGTCINFADFLDNIASIEVINLIRNPLVEVRFLDNVNLRLYMPDDLSQLYGGADDISNDIQLLRLRPNDEYCELLLAGFDQNLDPDANDYSTFVDITGSSAFVYAYCVKPNLPGIVDSGDDFPALESTIYEKSDVTLDSRIVPLPEDTYKQVHNVLVRANTGACQRGNNPGEPIVPAPISLDDDDFAVQLALFIVFDDFSADAIMTAFDNYFIQSKAWLYARDYDGIHCLLGIDDTSPYYATLDISQNRIEELAPYTFEFFDDVEISTGGQIARVEFELQDSDGNTLLQLDSFDTDEVDITSYDFVIAGDYQAIYRVYGTPFVASNARLEEPFELTEVTQTVDIVITAPVITLGDEEQQVEWYRQPYFQQNGTSITLLAFALCVIGGVPALGLSIAYAMSIASPRRRILVLSLIVLLVMLVMVGILTDRLANFW